MSVVFDANSFTGTGQTVTINQLAYCKDMTWTGVNNNPTLNGTQELDIYGSLTLSSAMTLTYTGNLYFKSNTTTATITTAGRIIRSSIYFDGTGGGWTLQDSLITKPTSLYLNNGSLNTNGQYVFIGRFNSAVSGVRSLTLGSSTVEVPFSHSSFNAWDVSASNFTVNAGTSLIKLTGLNPRFSGGFTYYDITFTNPTGSNVSLGPGTYHNVTFANEAGIYTSTFNNVIIGGNGFFSGNCNYNNLTLSPNKTYTFNNATTHAFNGNLTANGTCAGPIDVTCTTGFSTFSKSSGTVNINYIRLKNIHSTGGASFTANNVTDFGGNTGWLLNQPSAKTLYWIGNTGNWSDEAHWSTSSGGPSGNCLPSIYDHVVFDANSFTGTGDRKSVV